MIRFTIIPSQGEDALAVLPTHTDHVALFLSDSGGLQEEVTAPSIGKSIIVLRISTGRREAGCVRVMGFEKGAIWMEMEAHAGKRRPGPPHRAARPLEDDGAGARPREGGEQDRPDEVLRATVTLL